MDLKDALKDVNREALKEFCRGLFKDESEEQVQEQSDSEYETTPGESSATYVFIGDRDTRWPAPSGTSIREKAVARSKEQSDA